MPRTDRLHNAPNNRGLRSEFQRDRDAILHSDALRRLAEVTQVVSPSEGSVYHNRLTHSLKVAQIGQRLAQYFVHRQPELAAKYGIDSDAVEAAGLIHDLGHPPFGHIAEKELNRLLVKDGIVDGYEGNAQSFRIVTKLSVRNEDLPGLDLTRATLNASLKYPYLQAASDNPLGAPPESIQRRRKWGAYESERYEFEFARQESVEEHRSPEAQIMDWADDLAYSIHDTEDFYRAGLIPLDRFAQLPDAVEEFLTQVQHRWEEKSINTHIGWELAAECFRGICKWMPFEAYRPTEFQRAQLRGYMSDRLNRYLTATGLREEPDEFGGVLAISEEHLAEVELLKELTWQFVIKNPPLASIRHGQRRIISDLYRIFADCVLSGNRPSKWTLIPAKELDMLTRSVEENGVVPDSTKLRIVADAISSMTDRQATLMHQRLTGVSPGSVLDSIVG